MRVIFMFGDALVVGFVLRMIISPSAMFPPFWGYAVFNLTNTPKHTPGYGCTSKNIQDDSG